MWVVQIPQIVRHVPSQSHFCYTSHVSSRLPVSFVSLNASANHIKDTKSSNNQLIQSLCKGGNLKQALHLLCCEPNPTQQTFEHLIYSCAQQNSLANGLDIHRRLVNSGFDQDPFLATKLINMYYELGSIDRARKVFDETQERTIYVWNALFRALAMVGRGEELLDLYGQMNWIGIPLDRFTYTYALKACVVSELSVCPLRKGLSQFAAQVRCRLSLTLCKVDKARQNSRTLNTGSERTVFCFFTNHRHRSSAEAENHAKEDDEL
ncbi:Pentatricopeptide repeat-containing protein [Spatholobus suberectus]|nr:Pentatricopeptide repeat-containing protein [Spatholobus suberectus]